MNFRFILRYFVATAALGCVGLAQNTTLVRITTDGQTRELTLSHQAPLDPNADADADGLPDGWERLYFGLVGAVPGADPDNDGFTNLQEHQDGTNPTTPVFDPTDSDADGMSDAWELRYFGTLEYGPNDQFNDMDRTLLEYFQQGLVPRLMVPRVASGLRAWYSGGVGFFFDPNSGKVALWADLSGNGLHLRQTADALQPYFISLESGDQFMLFDGNQRMAAASADVMAGAIDLTVFAVIRPDGYQAVDATVLALGTGLSDGFRLKQNGSSLNQYALTWPQVAGQAMQGGSAAVAAETDAIQLIAFTKSGANQTSHLNGESLVTVPVALDLNPAGAPLLVGGPAGGAFSGAICEILIYNRALSAAERILVEDDLLRRYRLDDLDNSGLPDRWEKQYFGHTGVDPNADPDGDGVSNFSEYQAGTDPRVNNNSNSEDEDGNGLPDAWEQQNFGHLGVDPTTDADGDGLTNLQEFQQGTDPNVYDDNQRPKLTILSGNNQFTLAGQFNSQPFVVTVTNAAGTSPIINAPVIFTVQSGGGQLALTDTGTPELFITRTLMTDAAGTAQVYYKQPAAPDIISTIQVSAGIEQATVTTTSTAPILDSDNNGLSDSWELEYFGHIGVDNGDPDGDGLTNLHEFRVGSDPNNSSGSPRALVMPNADAFLFTGSNIAIPYLSYDGAMSAIGDHVSTGCLAYWSSWPGNSFSTFDTSFTAGALTINAVPSGYPEAIWIASSLNLKSGSALIIEFSINYDDSRGIHAVIYNHSGEYINTIHSDSATGIIAHLEIPADGEYFIALSTQGASANFIITSSDTMTVNPVIALWNDNGTTRQLRRCGKDPQLAVDANRDGEIKLASEDASDATSADRPYLFWINDDIDRGHTVDGDDYEQDDISPTEAATNNWVEDWKSNTVPFRRDLEDFARIVVSTSGLSDAFINGDLYLGLKWTDTVGTPSIKLYKQYDATGGTSYLTDDYQASVQLAENAILNQRYPSDDVASPSAHTVVTPGDVFVLPQALWFGLSGDTLKRSLLFEGCTAGKGQLKLVILKRENGNYTEIGDGPGVWLDLKNIKDMYEHWTVGQGPVPYGGGAPGALSQASSFTYTAQSPEESKYILFVHGWNMEKWEKERFAETAYKRLYWQGYKGRFGLFSWPTTNGFDESSVIADSNNYDRGEFSAWRSANLLEQKLALLNDQYPSQVYLLAHSMGNVVAGEALRRAGQDGLGVVVRTYVASQAALPAHCYNGGLPDSLDFDLSAIPGSGAVRVLDGGWPQTANAYKSWLTANSAAVAKRVNFYNVNDWALWHDKWGLNQWFKPDHPDFRPNPPDPQRTYAYLDDVNQPPTQDGFGWLRPSGQVDSSDRPSPYVSGWWYAVLRLGNAADVKDRYEIMAMASEARSNALGAISSDEGLGNRLSLASVWPSDPSPSNDNRPYARHKWHSAQFRSTNMLQKGYWQALLDDRGFNIVIQP